MNDKLPGRGKAAVVGVMLAGALAITACGDDDDKGTESAKPQKLALEVSKEGPKKFALSAPDSVEAGVAEITLTVPSGKETHDAQFLRIKGDHTLDEALKFLSQDGAPTPDWLFAAGGVGQTKPGTSASATQELVPGKYFIVDTSEPEGEDVPSYGEMGATAELEVTGESDAADLPQVDAKVTAVDFGFTSSGLKAGQNQIEFDNTGKEIHHVIAFPFAKGATLSAVKKAFTEDGEPSGPPPVDFESITTTAALEGGTKQIATLDLKQGKYALVCFISNRKGGPPHVTMGMIAEATVE